MIVHVIIHIYVSNYPRWEAVFEQSLAFRRASGELNYQLFVDREDSKQVTVISQWASFSQARNFFAHPEVKEAIKSAPGAKETEVLFLDLQAEGQL